MRNYDLMARCSVRYGGMFIGEMYPSKHVVLHITSSLDLFERGNAITKLGLFVVCFIVKETLYGWSFRIINIRFEGLVYIPL